MVKLMWGLQKGAETMQSAGGQDETVFEAEDTVIFLWKLQ